MLPLAVWNVPLQAAFGNESAFSDKGHWNIQPELSDVFFFPQKENEVSSPAAFHSAGAALKARQFQGRRKIALMNLLIYKGRNKNLPIKQRVHRYRH